MAAVMPKMPIIATSQEIKNARYCLSLRPASIINSFFITF
ncbi:hypothetical protein MYAER_1581 [Microcystis aeruginosa NIES-2549]|uniref:Uncharacterized protein n=1 Tax=Microcystis aeruginosa NIES-2549 TaxID=1641812 RepID=A0A0F6RKZ6_MICAE|nr:hypothetical protein MYAER_1581 [Microcystis aeruginosa NIES-2549]AOC52323.1 hypothetical protein amyaer_1596 [Microcystis aeruginosa NIES-2481]